MNNNHQSIYFFRSSPSSKEGDLFFILKLFIAIIIMSISILNAQNNLELWRFSFQLNDTINLNVDASVSNPLSSDADIHFPAYDTVLYSETKASFKSDSIVFTMGLYANKFLLKKISPEKITGKWIKYSGNKNYILPVTANKFDLSQLKQKERDIKLMKHFPKRWKFKIFSDTRVDEYIGVFHSYTFTKNYVRIKGSITTKFGDLGNLNGEIKNDSLYLSVFNGAFATQIISKIYHYKNTDSIQGFIYYGNWGFEKFTAIPDTSVELKNQIDVNEIFTQTNKLNLNFTDINGNPVKTEKDKPIIIQIMGSWCPNCIDETKVLSKLYDSLSDKIQIIALSVERTNDKIKGVENLNKLKIKYNIKYPVVLLSYTGTKDIQNFPELKKIPAFPTTIYLNKNHQPVFAFTGFSGPATGTEYYKTKREILNTIQKLIN